MNKLLLSAAVLAASVVVCHDEHENNHEQQAQAQLEHVETVQAEEVKAEEVTKQVRDENLANIEKLLTCSHEEIKPILEGLLAVITAEEKEAFVTVLSNYEVVAAMFHDEFHKELSKERFDEIVAVINEIHAALSTQE